MYKELLKIGIFVTLVLGNFVLGERLMFQKQRKLNWQDKNKENYDISLSDQRIMVAYTWGFGNIGDVAITPGLLNLLTKYFPDYKITVLEEIESQLYQKTTYLHKYFPQCEVLGSNVLRNAYNKAKIETRKDFGGKLPFINKSNINYIFETFAQRCVDFIERSHSKFTDALLNTKLVIYNSGMVLTYGEGTLGDRDFWGYTLWRSLPLLVAEKLRIPYGIYSHSFDSFGEPDSPGRLYYSRLLEDASFVFCRDSSSLRYLKEVGIKPPIVMFAPDSTFSFNGRDDEWAASFLKEHKLSPKCFMAVIIRTSVQGFISEEADKKHMKIVRGIIEDYVKTTNNKVLLCPEVHSEIYSAKELIYDRLSKTTREKCVWMDSFWKPEQAKGIYRQARIVMSMELHSLLLAIPEATPIIHIPFKEAGRKGQMIADIGLKKYLFDIDSISPKKIEQAVYYTYNHYEEISNKIQRDVLPYIREKERAAMKVIENIL